MNEGGLLGLLNVKGGRIIWLLIGRDAWLDTGNLRCARPLVGGVVLGSIVGILASAVFAHWSPLIVTPLVFALVGLLLEELRRVMNK